MNTGYIIVSHRIQKLIERTQQKSYKLGPNIMLNKDILDDLDSPSSTRSSFTDKATLPPLENNNIDVSAIKLVVEDGNDANLKDKNGTFLDFI